VVAGIKAAKNKTEQDGMRACNIRDCAAIMRYFAFLEEELRKPDHGLDEYKGAMIVGNYRKEVDMF
jgi:Xaa-Pro aminopeptidase